MALQIITADQRLAEKKGHKIVVCGQSGVGKTTLARTLEPQSTLFLDLEAGDAAIEGFPVDVLRPRTWQECRDLACFLGGPNPSLSEDQPYSQAHYDYVSTLFGDPDILLKYDTLFVDSITVAGRLCFQWCLQQPESRSERSGKLDTRAAYGMHGREMMAWLTHIQHIREKNVIFVGILDEVTDDYGRKSYALQIEGSKTGRELPGIVDEVITMSILSGDHGPYRAFVCQPLNEWGYPAKDRSGRLDVLEEPHLGNLIAKMNSGDSQAERGLTFVDPQTQTGEV
jgi:energy-coupling factor transporter ATP-binding protein EcfA2